MSLEEGEEVTFQVSSDRSVRRTRVEVEEEEEEEEAVILGPS
jgi:cold shock CspA family protein